MPASTARRGLCANASPVSSISAILSCLGGQKPPSSAIPLPSQLFSGPPDGPTTSSGQPPTSLSARSDGFLTVAAIQGGWVLDFLPACASWIPDKAPWDLMKSDTRLTPSVCASLH